MSTPVQQAPIQQSGTGDGPSPELKPPVPGKTPPDNEVGSSRMPFLLRISPAVAGLATAALVLMLAAGPLSPRGDMTVVAGSASGSAVAGRVSGSEEALPTAEECAKSLPRGWIVFCLRDGKDHCTTKVAEGELWVETSKHCWMRNVDVRFEDPRLELTDPPGTFAGDDLPAIARNAWEERRRAGEQEGLVEIQGLFDHQRWSDLESRAHSLMENGQIYSDDGKKTTEIHIGDAMSAQLEAYLLVVEPRLSSLELDAASVQGVFMNSSEKAKQLVGFQSKAVDLNRELDKMVDGLKNWKTLTGLVELQFQSSRQHLLDLHERVKRTLGDLAITRYKDLLASGQADPILQYEGAVQKPPTSCKGCGMSESKAWLAQVKTYRARVAERQQAVNAWKQKATGCEFPIENARWEAEGVLAVQTLPTRGGIPVVEVPQTVRFKWDGQTRGLIPKESWNAW